MRFGEFQLIFLLSAIFEARPRPECPRLPINSFSKYMETLEQHCFVDQR
jgi:hypothetical protein